MLEIFAGSGYALGDRSCKKPILGLDTLHHHVYGRLLGAIVFEDAVGFVRPDNLSIVRLPAKAARMTKSLSFGQISFAPPDYFFGNFALRDIHYRADSFLVTRLVNQGV